MFVAPRRPPSVVSPLMCSYFPLPSARLLAPLLLAGLVACSGNPPGEQPGAAQAALTASSPAPTVPGLALIDQQNGFRDHHFGDPLTSFPGLHPSPYSAAVSPDVREYEKSAAQEQLQVGDAKLRQLHYSFYQGRFYQVTIRGAGLGSAGLLAALTSRYGPPTQPNPYQREYWWHGQQASALLTQPGSDAPLLLLWNNALRQQAEAARPASTRGL